MKKNIWHPVTFQPELTVGQYVVPNFVSNSVAIRLSDKEFVLYSPGESLLASWPDKWRSTDTKMHIIMPNGFHYMGVAAWQTAFPNHQLYASNAAIPRLIKQSVAPAESDIIPLEKQQPPLPESYSVLFPPGHRAGDIWLKKDNGDGSSVWVTCDSFLNYERVSNQPVARFAQKLLGAAPGLKISQVVKWFIMNNRKLFKQWALQQLANDKPTTLMPSHGEIAQTDALPEQLEDLIKQRL
ncbi:hypothetical protein MIB92_04075 [Aestuariirhabdus sp. Z084]|uniref:hypothetical protein n=1 Tax=Aestuariirhabdus haliotis TaxID=2918751 RepID=UPI00201B35BC|nr:hypothetical protein [Aestuariirhabdus haliotis]MCL6414819.1 hypothetical protein [Aestuariirhabdus haliotis]MCL6418751.1 hypothetical protein [Aestuariirhabdus haliotis]